MRFLANENFPGDAVTALEATGHDIVWVRTAAPALQLGAEMQSIRVSNNRGYKTDFGRLFSTR